MQGGVNLYGYCGEDPVTGVDPLGLCTAEQLMRDDQAWADEIHVYRYGSTFTPEYLDACQKDFGNAGAIPLVGLGVNILNACLYEARGRHTQALCAAGFAALDVAAPAIGEKVGEAFEAGAEAVQSWKAARAAGKGVEEAVESSVVQGIEETVEPSVVQANRSFGKAAEETLSNMYGGGGKGIMTSEGMRYIDNLTKINGQIVAQEAKTGRICLSGFIRKQIIKDQLLLAIGKVDVVEWHFFIGRTGKFGPSETLYAALSDAGIAIKYHY